MMLTETGSHAEKSSRSGLCKGKQIALAFNMLLLKHLLIDIIRRHWKIWVGVQKTGGSWAAIIDTKVVGEAIEIQELFQRCPGI